MPQALHVLPDSTGTAAQNMAYDFLMLQRYQPSDAIRIRHYEWLRPSFTFGLSQRYSYVESEIPSSANDVCRRPTGGGVVDHQDDWTYSLVIPTRHPMSRGQPIETYRAVHQAIVDAMEKQGAEVELNLNAHIDPIPGVCFNKPELYDIVLRNLPTKVAGAAQKRTKAGFLMQGSIWKPTVSNLDWETFYQDFVSELAKVLDADAEPTPNPTWDPNEEEMLINQFDSEEWNHRR